MKKDRFIIELKKININLTDKQINQFITYYNLLVEYNQKFNLTALIKEEDVYLKHFYDSLTLSLAINLNNQYLCDIGSGAGFPGIVLKIVYPNLSIDLIEANSKKCLFLEKVIKTLNLTNIRVINTRCEEYSPKNKEIYDIATARAVSNINILLECIANSIKVNGVFIAMKSTTKELDNLNNTLNKLNFNITNINTLNLPIENSLRTIITFKKLKETPSIYPRMYKDIKKKPL
ncbi:MAG: 16S rRNA (guanine(527)-N(7))-methyltransferase RsmG [bacterium]|nr:16S rRNA (guanine(527)-N(7))-methyltransferase RsmG [bacterium]